MSTVTKEGTPNRMQGSEQLGDMPINQLPSGELWHNSAPSSVRNAWSDDPDAAWQLWTSSLDDKRILLPQASSLQEAKAWGLATQADALERVLRIADAVTAKAGDDALESAAESWVEARMATAGEAPTLAVALESVAWGYGLAKAAPRLDSGVWWRLVDHLRLQMHAAQEQAIGSELEDADAEAVLVHQLLAGELPLMLSASLPELKPLRGLRKEATAALTEGVLAMTDGEGVLPARCLPLLPAMLACWTRCRALAKHIGKRCFDASAQTQYEWLVRQALRLARPDGTLALSQRSTDHVANGRVAKADKSLWQAALDLGGDDADLAAAKTRLRMKSLSPEEDDLPEPSLNSEWAGLAVLANGWKPKAPRLIVAYEGERVLLEASAGGSVLLSGEWPVELKMEGKQVATTGDWEEQCWFSDDDSDYLEIAIDLANGAKLERQIFFAHDSGIAYLSEIVLSRADEPGAIELQLRLPLAQGIGLQPTEETREGWLAQGDERLVGVVPVGLAEWRIDPRTGDMQVTDSHLCVAAERMGRNLCCPLVLDFKPRRYAKQRTWRQLTVAQSLESVESDVAVAYRYQSGKEQMVMYRSLDPPANRTFIGQNYSSEAVIGRFLESGELDEYFEIDPEDD